MVSLRALNGLEHKNHDETNTMFYNSHLVTLHGLSRCSIAWTLSSITTNCRNYRQFGVAVILFFVVHSYCLFSPHYGF